MIFFRSETRGNVSVSSVLLSAEELERYFPDKRLKVWAGCWNMGEIKVYTFCTSLLVNLPSGLEIGLIFSGSPSSRVTNSSLQVAFGDLLNKLKAYVNLSPIMHTM